MADDKERNKSSIWKRAAVIGAAAATMFGANIQEAEAADQQYQNNEQRITMDMQQKQQGSSKIIISEQVTPNQQYNRLTKQIAAINLKITQLARNRNIFVRRNDVDGANRIFEEMKQLDSQKKELMKQLVETQMQMEQKQNSQSEQQQTQVKGQQNEQSDRAQFAQSLKVAKPMSDEEFWRIANEAKETGQKITDPAWIAKLQEMRQKAARAKQQNAMNKQAPEQER